MSINDLQVLHAYVRLVELGSFTAVADELGVGQPTVSRWIARLEEELGVQLLDRTTRSLSVRPAGARFCAEARDVLDAHQRALASARQEAASLRGTLRLALPVVFGERHVLPLLPGFLAAHPELRLELSLGERYVRLVEDGFDAAIRLGPVDASSLTSRTLARSPRRLVAAPGLADRIREPDDLARLPGLLHSAHAAADWPLSRPSEHTRVRLQPRVRADSSEALRQLAVAGHGVARLASWLVDADIAAGRLVALLPDWDAGSAEVRFLTPPGRMLPPRTRALSDHLAAAIPQRLLPPM